MIYVCLVICSNGLLCSVSIDVLLLYATLLFCSNTFTTNLHWFESLASLALLTRGRRWYNIVGVSGML